MRMGLATSSGISIFGEPKDRMWVRRMAPHSQWELRVHFMFKETEGDDIISTSKD